MTYRQIKGGANDPHRKAELAKIHALKKNVGLDEDTYRAMLNAQTGLESSAKMTRGQRLTVIKYLQTQLGKLSDDGKPHNLKQNPQLQKIEALLTVQHKPWAYAQTLAKRMYHKEALAFCSGKELRGIIAALVKAGG